MKRPSFQFYPGDWLRDFALRAVSVEARGAWIDMLCLMHEGTPYGYLKVNRKVILPDNLGVILGVDPKVAARLLAELEEAGVFSRGPEGCIFSRRMVRDEEIRAKRAAGGVCGGNPSLLKNRKVNLRDNLADNLQGNLGVNHAPEDEDEDSIPSEPKAKKKPLGETQGAEKKKERPRDLLFDALAKLDGGPDGMTEDAKRKVGVKIAAIKRASPDVTPEEIDRRGENLARWFPNAAVTASSLASHWARCATPPVAPNGRAALPPDVRRGLEATIRRKREELTRIGPSDQYSREEASKTIEEAQLRLAGVPS